jgi:site-specific DNA recombinase
MSARDDFKSATFERGVTGERIRDKIAASKKRGIWMGGVVPLGYRVEDRRCISSRSTPRSCGTFFASISRRGALFASDSNSTPRGFEFRSESTARNDRRAATHSAAGIFKILSNPIYIGRIRHKGQVHEGLHAAIIDPQIWDRVQRQLADHAKGKNRSYQDSDALLAGKLFDDRGNKMSPSDAAKGGRQWRYYVSQAFLQGRKQDAGSVARAPAEEIEHVFFHGIGAQTHI